LCSLGATEITGVINFVEVAARPQRVRCDTYLQKEGLSELLIWFQRNSPVSVEGSCVSPRELESSTPTSASCPPRPSHCACAAGVALGLRNGAENVEELLASFFFVSCTGKSLLQNFFTGIF